MEEFLCQPVDHHVAWTSIEGDDDVTADGERVTPDGTLPIEDPPEWPEARKPGSGLPQDGL